VASVLINAFSTESMGGRYILLIPNFIDYDLLIAQTSATVAGERELRSSRAAIPI